MPNLKNQIAEAYLLKPALFGERKELKFASDTDGLTLTLPKTAPDKISSTMVLEIPGMPQIE